MCDLPAFFVERLIHDSRFNHVGRRAHGGSHESGAAAAQYVKKMVVRKAGLLHYEPFRHVVRSQITEVHQRRSLNVRYGT